MNKVLSSVLCLVLLAACGGDKKHTPPVTVNVTPSLDLGNMLDLEMLSALVLESSDAQTIEKSLNSPESINNVDLFNNETGVASPDGNIDFISVTEYDAGFSFDINFPDGEKQYLNKIELEYDESTGETQVYSYGNEDYYHEPYHAYGYHGRPSIYGYMHRPHRTFYHNPVYLGLGLGIALAYPSYYGQYDAISNRSYRSNMATRRSTTTTKTTNITKSTPKRPSTNKSIKGGSGKLAKSGKYAKRSSGKTQKSFNKTKKAVDKGKVTLGNKGNKSGSKNKAISGRKTASKPKTKVKPAPRKSTQPKKSTRPK